MRVADYIISFLEKRGTKHIFMLTGGGAMFLDDAVKQNKNVKAVCQQHEQSCALAAEAYSRVSGGLGVAIVTSGPGSTNAITGVLNAWQDSIPCLIISGQAKRADIICNSGIKGMRQLGSQEVNIIPVVKSITKYSETVNDPNLIRYCLEKAIYFAKEGRPGPVWLDIPLDVQSSIINKNGLKKFDKNEVKKTKINPLKKEIDFVVRCLKKSKRPLIIAGGGIRLSGAVNEFLMLIKQLRIPVVNTVMGIDVLDFNNPFYIGRGGIKGQRAANIAIQNSDLIISIGSRLSIPFVGYDYKKFANQAKKIVVDIDKIEHRKKIIKIDKLIISDVKNFIKKLITEIKQKKYVFSDLWLENCKKIKEKYPVCLQEYKNVKGKMNMYYIVDTISSVLNKNDFIVTDAGSAFYVVSQAFKIKQGQRFIMPGATGAMGYNLPASIGACFANKEKRLVCITGDGSFQMNINELITIVKYALPIKIFIFNNGGYLSIRNTQKKFFGGRLIGESDSSGVGMVNLKNISKAFGVSFFKIKNGDQLQKDVKRVLSKKGPVICELMCLDEQLIIPTIASRQNSDGSMVSSTLDDMFPFLSLEEMDEIKKLLGN